VIELAGLAVLCGAVCFMGGVIAAQRYYLRRMQADLDAGEPCWRCKGTGLERQR